MQRDPFETEVYNGHVIALYYDEDAECPLDNEVHLQKSQRQLRPGASYQTPGVYFILFDNMSVLSNYHHFNSADRGGPGEVLRFAAKEGYHVFGLYGHSGVSGYESSFSAEPAPAEWAAMLVREKLNISRAGSGADITCDDEMPTCELDQWELDTADSRRNYHIGFVLIKYDEWAVDKYAEALALANVWCDSVKKWCNGEYCGYAVFPKGHGIDPDTGKVVVDELDLTDATDSCWNFDDAEYAMQEAKSQVDYYMRKEAA